MPIFAANLCKFVQVSAEAELVDALRSLVYFCAGVQSALASLSQPTANTQFKSNT